MRVAVVTTHPIQYQVPWLRRLSTREGVDLQVYFAMIPDAVVTGDNAWSGLLDQGPAE